ncbi:E3 ubiquitin-protein ligase RNF123 [Channa argus]|uniref:E3 ubiquitin-protein ligase RNF123 n=1 Tax=Channa argus TaxID=215402 RepID=A0A6G1PJ65_CHAAH|nr:E3 ubiquitin-protein ligase RNF123 [Channa argus]
MRDEVSGEGGKEALCVKCDGCFNEKVQLRLLQLSAFNSCKEKEQVGALNISTDPGQCHSSKSCQLEVKKTTEATLENPRTSTDDNLSLVFRAASVLLSDPCFQLHSIQHLLGEGGESSSSSAATTSPNARPVVMSLGSSVTPPVPSAAGNPERKHFSLHAYGLQNLLTQKPEVLRPSPEKPDSFPINRACINQHLMNNKDCFFCKATITGVEDYSKPAAS